MRRFQTQPRLAKNIVPLPVLLNAALLVAVFGSLSSAQTPAPTDPFMQQTPKTTDPFAMPAREETAKPKANPFAQDSLGAGQEPAPEMRSADPFGTPKESVDESAESAVPTDLSGSGTRELEQANPFAAEVPTNSPIPAGSGSIGEGPETADPSALNQGDGTESTPVASPFESPFESRQPDVSLNTFPSGESTPPEPEAKQPMPKSESMADSQSQGWVGWLLKNWYWPLAAVVLSLVGWRFLRAGARKRQPDNLVDPEPKRGSFKKSTRYQNVANAVRKPEEIASEIVASNGSSDEIDTRPPEDKFAFDEEESVDDFSAASTTEAVATGLPNAADLEGESNGGDDSDIDLGMEDESDEFSFDLEDDTDAGDDKHPFNEESTHPGLETADGKVVTDPDGVEGGLAFSNPDEVTPTGGLTFAGDAMVINVPNDEISLDPEVEPPAEVVEADDNPSIGGLTAAAGGAIAGVGAMLAGGSVTEDSSSNDSSATDELRAQLIQLQEKEQRQADELQRQQVELADLKSKLVEGNTASEKILQLESTVKSLQDEKQLAAETTESLKQQSTELGEKLDIAEKNVAEFETRLLKAESHLDGMEKEKEELAAELAERAANDATLKKMEEELAVAIQAAESHVAENEKLQSAISQLQNQLEERDAQAPPMPTSSLISTALAADEETASGDLTSDDHGSARQLAELESQLADETALRKRTEAMLVQAEEQRTEVALALRALKKQAKEEKSDSAPEASTIATEEIDLLKKQLADETSANEELESQLKKVKQQLAQEHSVAKELTDRLSMSEGKVVAATTSQDEWAKKLEAVESELELKKKDSERLNADLSEVQSALEESEKSVANLEEKVRSRADEASSLTQDLEQSRKAADEAIAKQSALEASLREQATQLESLRSKEADLESTISELEQKSGTFSYGQLEAALASVATLGDEQNKLNLKLAQSRDGQQQSERANARLTEAVVQLEKQLARSDEQKKELAEARQQIDAERSRSVDVDKQNNAMQLQLDQLKQNVESLDRQRLSLKENLEAREKEAAHTEATKTREIAALGKKVAELEQQLAAAESESAQSKDHLLQLESQKENLASAKEENAVLAERIQGLQQQFEERKLDARDLESLQQHSASQAEQLDKVKQELAEASNIRAVLEQESVGLKEQLQRTEGIAAKNERLNQKLGFLQRELDEAEKTNRQLQSRLTEGQSDGDLGSVSASSSQFQVILDQLQAQNHQINQLVSESTRLSTASVGRKRKNIPEGCDDLSKIRGIGPQYRAKLFQLGVKTFREISQWTEADVKQFNDRLGCKSNRIEHEQWIEQAKKLV